MGRGGQQKHRAEPERRCIVTGQTRPRSDLVRFVVGPENEIVPDILGKLPGRGGYVSAERKAVNKAAQKGLFARAMRHPVRVPDDLPDLIEGQLASRVVHLISLCRKAGQAIAGFEKVKRALANEHVSILFQAYDGSARGKGKLWTPEGARWFGCLSADELGLAFGQTHVIHGAVLAGGLVDTVVEEAAKLDGMRCTPPTNGDKNLDER